MRGFLLFVFFFMLTFGLYYPTAHARFVFDFIDWFGVYESEGWRGFLVDFHDVALRPVSHLINYPLHFLLGLDATAWLILATSIHAATAAIAYCFIRKSLMLSHVARPDFIAFFSSLFFLISPYQTEALVWGGDFFYLPTALFLICSLGQFLSFADTGQASYLYRYLLFFLFSVFCHEIGFIIPILAALFIVALPDMSSNGQGKRGLLMKTVFLPLAFLPIYLLLDKIFLGQWIGHYGASVHLHFDIKEVFGKLNMYAAKFYLFAPFWKPHIYIWCRKPIMIYLTISIMLISALALMAPLKGRALRYALVFVFATVVSLAMVLNLYLVDFINIQSDRLGYFAAIFAFVPLMVALSRCPRILAYTGAVLFTVLSLYTLNINISSWHHAGQLAMALDKDFKYAKAENLYILNLPDNYKGAYIYRCRAQGKYAQKQKMLYGGDFHAKEIDVLSYNLNDASDSVTVEKISDSSLRVSFTKWGSWFWRNTCGASSYEDSLVRVDIDAWNHSYIATFKNKKPGDVFLYQAADHWRRVDGF